MCGRDQDLDLLADQLFLLVAEKTRDRGVDGFDDAGLVERRQAVGHVVQHRSHPLLALLQRHLGALTLHELADLCPDVVHHCQQRFIELAWRPGRKRDDADHSPAAPHRKGRQAMKTYRQRSGRARGLILRKVLD